jgi:hypothetical protein
LWLTLASTSASTPIHDAFSAVDDNLTAAVYSP